MKIKFPIAGLVMSILGFLMIIPLTKCASVRKILLADLSLRLLSGVLYLYALRELSDSTLSLLYAARILQIASFQMRQLQGIADRPWR